MSAKKPPKPITWKASPEGLRSSRGGLLICAEEGRHLIYDKFGDVAETAESEEGAKKLGVEILTIRTYKCPLCLEYDHRKLVRFDGQRGCVECADESDNQQALREDEFQQSLEEDSEDAP